jgi:hypothetical protein
LFEPPPGFGLALPDGQDPPASVAQLLLRSVVAGAVSSDLALPESDI